ncbi:hypothetical protein [Gordonia polyisoprenivorans]|uniref:hypothetical protein n=1 Tax=Gordonia polyisoprenivorans TaxID=84595 RepID=UPI0003A500FE|nr:hypothetical protein [Gordonia polyisoprenivorans]
MMRNAITLADDDDPVRDLRCEQLAGIEPIDISDLLELADGVLALRPGENGKR